jgi:hemerythrin-like domain-containing protein
MHHATLDILLEEHQALAAMLRSLQMLLTQARRTGGLPDFDVVRAMLFYVDEFPEKRHHRKEAEWLFPALRRHCPELAPVLDRLDSDHALGERAIRNMEHALLAFEVLGEVRRAAFEEAVDQYISFYLEHMAVEERELLPAAQRAFDAAEWAELDRAFAADRDPLTGLEPADDFRPLLRRIRRSAPAPVGAGPAH